MVNIEYIEGESTFQINNVTLVRNFHSYVSGTKIRVVNAYDTTDELVPYTLFSGISINGVVYNSVIELAEVLSPILFLKQGGSGTGVSSLSGNIVTRVVVVQMDWTLNSVQQIIDFVNNQEFSVSGSQRILFKAIRIIGDVAASNATESYFWEFKPGKGNYGVNGIPITSGDLEFISFVTNFQNNVIDLGEIGSTPIEIFINDNGPYAIIASALNVFKSLRQGSAVNYIYIGNKTNIGLGQSQTVSDDYIDVNAEPVNPPASTSGLDVPSQLGLVPVSQADGSIVWVEKINSISINGGTPQTSIAGLIDLTIPGGGSGITGRYLTYAAMVAAKGSQVDKGIYTVADASGFSTVDAGYADFEYLGTTLGTEADYRKLSEQESMDVAGGTGEVNNSNIRTIEIPITSLPANFTKADCLAYLNTNGFVKTGDETIRWKTIGDTTAPSSPTGLTISNITDTSATATWNASTDY
jgi:hypothetical protein